jgi:REP element-mobilizing transposase RayT
LTGFDYTQPGLYFVTVCTWAREPLLGQVVAGKVQLSQAGRAALEAWAALPLRFPAIDLDAFVVMPTHVHGILVVGGDPDLAPDVARPHLAAVMRAFKSVSGIQGNRALGRTNQPFWQRSYHDRIVRNARELALIRQYIADNPDRWETDADNPSPTNPTRPP